MNYMIKSVFVFFLILNGFFFTVYAQEGKPVSISDPGDLFSTFDFKASDKEAVIVAVGADKYKEINNACHESQWPSGIATLDNRNAAREKMKQYRIVLVTTIGDKSIVEIRPAENMHMPVNMQSTVSFYFVIKSTGLGTGTIVTNVDSGINYRSGATHVGI
jgi:hypothetical protein